MHPSPNTYGLLYIDPNNNRHVNIRSRRDPIDIYLLCAANCNRSFRQFGMSFKLITNDRTLLVEHLHRFNIFDLEVVQHEFVLPVPTGIPFFSAHFKLELYNLFAGGNYGEFVALVDIDTLLLRRLTTSEDLSVYDISDEVFPRYGKDVVIRDLQLLTGRRFLNGRWYGGEFVLGSSQQFAELAQFINFCWPRYLENINTVHHVGDEMVLSAALNLYSEKHHVADYGDSGNVARWWSSRTFNNQLPFCDVQNAALLHLPADKAFMAGVNLDKLTKQALLDKYQKYVRRKIRLRSIIFGLVNSSSKKFIPRLS
jgi:hypothetical protein